MDSIQVVQGMHAVSQIEKFNTNDFLVFAQHYIFYSHNGALSFDSCTFSNFKIGNGTKGTIPKGPISIINDSMAYFVGDSSIYMSIDTGANWKELNINKIYFGHEDGRYIEFVNKDTGIVYYHDFYQKTYILRTLNGGQSWNADTLVGFPFSHESSFLHKNGIYYLLTNSNVVGGNVLLNYSMDYGNSWATEVIDNLNNLLFLDMEFSDPKHGFITGFNHKIYIFDLDSLTNSNADIKKQNESRIKIFPNPISQLVHVELASPDYIQKIELFSITGELISTGNYNSNLIKMDLSIYPQSVYYLVVYDSYGNKISKLVFVKK